MLKCLSIDKSAVLQTGRHVCALVFVAWGEAQQACNAQITGRVGTRDVSIELRAEATAPRLSRIGLRGTQGWRNETAEELIASADINGRHHDLAWTLNAAASSTNEHQVVFVYECLEPHLQLRWTWIAQSGGGPVEHTTQIENLDTREIWIPLQESLRFSVPVAAASRLRHVYIDKGAGKPSEIGTHADEMPVGYRWSGTSSTYAQLFNDKPREVIPWFAIQNFDPAESGWYAGVEFSGRIRLNCERSARSVQGVIGLNPEPGSSFRTRLEPGESFATPTVFLGAYRGGLDGMGNVLRPWVREVLGNRQAWRDAKYPLTVNNSWGSGMQVDESLALKMIRDSAELGLEMFHLDAGWFRAVGDWRPDPKKFPRGLVYLAGIAHLHGLRFGIWVDWTQAGISRQPGALNVRDPKVRDWMVSNLPSDWRPHEFKGQTIDLGVPAAQQYADSELNRLVNDYRLDMLEHDGYLVAQGCVRRDHPHAPPDTSDLHIFFTRDGNSAVESSNSTDVSYHAVRAYYAVYAKLRQNHPQLLLEICNDGGRMVDFGSAAHGDYFSITDSYDPLSNRQAFYDASHLLPPAMLESYVEKWPSRTIENFRYMLRSGMMGWLTLMLDTTGWSAAEHAAAKAEMQVYQQQLRPLIRDAALYHVAPRPDGLHWDGIEYFDSKQQKGVLYAFRGSDPKDSEYVYHLRGTVPGRKYRVHFRDGSSPDLVIRGEKLLSSGITVRLPVPNSSELAFLDAIERR